MVYKLPLMIDSGAFSAFYRGADIRLGPYMKFCKEMAPEFPQAVFVNLDELNKDRTAAGRERQGRVSYRNWRTMLDEGIKALPVYHVTTDEKWLRLYLKRTDHVAVGAIAKASSAQRVVALDRVWERYLIDTKTRLPTVKVHGMGITSFPLMLRYPWHSVDSTAWIRVAMFGHILVPPLKNGEWDFSQPPMKVGMSDRCPDRRVKGAHYTNMSPARRRTLLRYVRELGFKIGFSCDTEDGKRVTARGLTTSYEQRFQIVMEYFGGFLASAPWPRAFQPTSKGLGMV